MFLPLTPLLLPRLYLPRHYSPPLPARRLTPMGGRSRLRWRAVIPLKRARQIDLRAVEYRRVGVEYLVRWLTAWSWTVEEDPRDQQMLEYGMISLKRS